MPRLPAVTQSGVGLAVRLTYRYLVRRFGAVPEPFAVLARHRRLFLANAVHEAVAGMAANVLPANLSGLAVYRVATTVGCSWCVDFGAMMYRMAGLDVARLRHIDDYRTSRYYTADERAAIGYADAMTATPPEVTDTQVDDLRTRVGDAGLLELTYVIAQENLRSRMNTALGITAQGFSAVGMCGVEPGSTDRDRASVSTPGPDVPGSQHRPGTGRPGPRGNS